jgi:formylglycine-generating enzyme required for sulfatase activity
MRLLPLMFLTLAGSLAAGEPTPAAYPLWDGQESVADYARRVKLPATKTLDIGGGVTMELVLIPAGKFMMGTPEPAPVDEDGFHRKFVIGQALLAASGAALLILLAVIIVQAIRKRQRPKYSLVWLLAMTVTAGIAVLSGTHLRQTARGLEAARNEYRAALARYKAAYDCEKPGHAVTLTNAFYIGKFPVTQEQYQAVVSANPGKFWWKLLEKDSSKKSVIRDRNQPRNKDIPVSKVSWGDAQAFCLSATAKSKQAVRLPTEAEWEYACRAGSTSKYQSGDTDGDYARVAWPCDYTSHPVGQKEPNAFGLYDMLGNVWQVCQDRFGDGDYYEKSEFENPQGPQIVGTSSHIVARGGSWYSEPVGSDGRAGDTPDNRNDSGGFRVVVPASTNP